MTHKLIFSNDYDGRVHVDFEHVPAAGVKFVGPLGLLGELEQRAGLTAGEVNEVDRIARLKAALEDYVCTNPGAIFKKSFERDNETVAERILRWRDALVMAGWNADVKVESPLLDEMAQIEAAFKKAKGDKCYDSVADRWIKVLEYCKSNPLKGFEIEVLSEMSHVNPTILAVLDAIKAKGGKVDFIHNIEQNPTIRAYQFDDVYDAYLHAAISLDPKKDIIIVQDSKAFNNFLNLVGRSNSASTLKDCNAPILQLFKLQLLLLAEPTNIYNMVSYLKTRPCPVKGGSRLAEYLMKNCGWGDDNDWAAFLDKTYKKDGEDVPVLDDKQKEAIQAFKNRMTARNTEIRFSDVHQAVKDLKSWAENQTRAADSETVEYSLTPTERAELNTIKGFCNRFMGIGCSENDIVTPDEITRYAETIYEAGEYEYTEARVDSFETYPSLGCIYSPVIDGKVVWIDCHGELPIEYDYDFLSAAEKKDLTKNGIRIWDTADQAAAKVASLKHAALTCGKELVLYVPVKSAGETVKASPLMTCLGVKTENAPDLRVEEMDIVGLPAKKLYYELEKGISKHREKDESYSSLELLIDYPLEYVMQYLAGMYAPDFKGLEGISRIEGLIAHKTLENLINHFNKDVKLIQKEVSTNLDSWIDDAAKQVGLVMMLPENAVEFSSLKNKLKVSFTNLLNIILSNNLAIVGMEMPYTEGKSPVTGGCSGLEAKIDLVLKDSKGCHYIFDLKYSTSNKYRDSLKENHDKVMQLDIYRHCVQKAGKANVVLTGFYLLPEGKLYTADSVLKRDDNVTLIEKAKDAIQNPIERITNSYAYRYGEFAEGRIEEGEGEGCKRQTSRSEAQENLDYYREEKNKCLYPLNIYGDKKAENTYSKYKVFKGGQK